MVVVVVLQLYHDQASFGRRREREALFGEVLISVSRSQFATLLFAVSTSDSIFTRL